MSTDLPKDVRNRLPAEAAPTLPKSPTQFSALSSSGSANFSGTKPKHLEEASSFGILDIFRMLSGALLLSCLVSYFVTEDSFLWGYKPRWLSKNSFRQTFTEPRWFTLEELKKFDGSDPNLPIYLSINGTVFDVSASPHVYGPGGGYAFFTGRDATRAFVTGCFRDDLTHDLRGVEDMYKPWVEPGSMPSIHSARREIWERERTAEALKKVTAQVKHWEDFFMKSEKYKYVGKVKLPSLRNTEPWPFCEKVRPRNPHGDGKSKEEIEMEKRKGEKMQGSGEWATKKQS